MAKLCFSEHYERCQSAICISTVSLHSWTTAETTLPCLTFGYPFGGIFKHIRCIHVCQLGGSKSTIRSTYVYLAVFVHAERTVFSTQGRQEPFQVFSEIIIILIFQQKIYLNFKNMQNVLQHYYEKNYIELFTYLSHRMPLVYQWCIMRSLLHMQMLNVDIVLGLHRNHLSTIDIWLESQLSQNTPHFPIVLLISQVNAISRSIATVYWSPNTIWYCYKYSISSLLQAE